MTTNNIDLSVLTPAQRGRHPWREILHRVRDPRFVADCAVRVSMMGWDLVSPSEFSSLYRKIRPYTMCSNARLHGLYRAVRHVVCHDVPGDIVECGSARGGSAALMALTLQQLGAHRNLWLFDTFEGLPAPTSNDPDYDIANLFTGTCVGTVENVRQLFHRLNVDSGVNFVKGLFQETLRASQVLQIAVLHIDGDWHESVKVCLDEFYDKVVPGGVIQFDDYGYWKGARRAIDEFFEKRRISPKLVRLDYSGRFLIKPT
jgi:O-methyltransferase